MGKNSNGDWKIWRENFSIEIKIGDFKVAEKGRIYEGIDEKQIKEYMEWESLKIEINLKIGQAYYECYTCDFTKNYIDINADYRS